MTATVTNSGDGVSWSGEGDNVTIAFTLLGGLYALTSQSSSTNSLQLNAIAPDGSTAIPCSASAQTAGYATYSLSPGSYNIVTGAAYATGQGALVKVPYRAA